MHILLSRGAMFDIATHMLRSMSILLRYFLLITATAEKLALHKYDVAKGTRTRRACTTYKWKLKSSLNPE